MFKQIICGIIIILISGWIVYVSNKGMNTDALIAGVNTRVSVQESVTSTIKEDIKEVKGDMKIMIGVVQEIRSDQIRRTNKENGRR